jgi:hypothetical protein
MENFSFEIRKTGDGGYIDVCVPGYCIGVIDCEDNTIIINTEKICSLSPNDLRFLADKMEEKGFINTLK